MKFSRCFEKRLDGFGGTGALAICGWRGFLHEMEYEIKFYLRCCPIILVLATLLGCVSPSSTPPHTEHAARIDLVDLVRMFTPPPSHDTVAWTTGATEASPIRWTTNERFGFMPKIKYYQDNFSCVRNGSTCVTVSGKPTHTQFDKTIHPANWDVNLYGAMHGATCVQLGSYGTEFDDEPNPMQALSKYAKLMLTHPESGIGFIGQLYKVTFPDREPCWLVETWSKGNHMWSFEFTLFFGETGYPAAYYFLAGKLTTEFSSTDNQGVPVQ